MSKTNHNKTFATLCGGIAAIIATLLLTLLSCNTPQRASRKFDKANRMSHITVLNKCSELSPPVTITKDSFIYKQGESIVFQDTVVFHDTITNTITKYITKLNKQTDTVYKSQRIVEVDRNKEKAQELIITEQHKTIAAAKQANRIMLWALVLLAAYTLARWLLQYWNIKLP